MRSLLVHTVVLSSESYNKHSEFPKRHLLLEQRYFRSEQNSVKVIHLDSMESIHRIHKLETFDLHHNLIEYYKLLRLHLYINLFRGNCLKGNGESLNFVELHWKGCNQ